MGAPVDDTNDVHVIAQLDNFISINNAVDVDLFGQVNAESAGLKHISGTGGQLDFVLGAYLSKGGKSFICLSSTMTGKDRQMKSRIVPTLTNGSITTDPRSAVHYLVTGVRHGQPEGGLHLGAGGEDHLHRPPRLPGGADCPGREDRYLAKEQPVTKPTTKCGRHQPLLKGWCLR